MDTALGLGYSHSYFNYSVSDAWLYLNLWLSSPSVIAAAETPLTDDSQGSVWQFEKKLVLRVPSRTL